MRAQAGLLILIGLILFGLGLFWALHLTGLINIVSIPMITDYDLYIAAGITVIGVLMLLLGKHIW